VKDKPSLIICRTIIVPVVGAETFCRIIGKPAVGFAVDGDAVVVVKTDQV
jgi:hypothetical protein